MDTAQWSQDIASNTCGSQSLERKTKPLEQLNCPRCNSTNTKFCYYNNYSLTQPRYFCKTCRRYWTEGGSLRNVPVGGGSRKNKKPSSYSSSTVSSKLPDLNPTTNFSQFSIQNPNNKTTLEPQDLNLAFPITQEYLNLTSGSQQMDPIQNNNNHQQSVSCSPHFSHLELVRTGDHSSRGLNSFTAQMPLPMPMPMNDSNMLYPSGFSFQELKPTLNFSLDAIGSRYEAVENGGRVLFPFGEFKQLPNATQVDQSNKGQGSSTGYWSGMLGGGSW